MNTELKRQTHTNSMRDEFTMHSQFGYPITYLTGFRLILVFLLWDFWIMEQKNKKMHVRLNSGARRDTKNIELANFFLFWYIGLSLGMKRITGLIESHTTFCVRIEFLKFYERWNFAYRIIASTNCRLIYAELKILRFLSLFLNLFFENRHSFSEL